MKIQNERQYRITQALAAGFRTTLDDLTATPRPRTIDQKLWTAQKAGIESQLQDLVAELHEYESVVGRPPNC